jgi:hypothetical protein
LDLLLGKLPQREQILKALGVDVNLEFAGAA